MTVRKLNIYVVTLCMLSLVGAFFIEYYYRVTPCPLCLLQRFSIAFIVLFQFLFLVHRHAGLKASWFYTVVSFFFAVCGLALASRQVWLQYVPSDKPLACLPGLGFLIKNYSFGDVLKVVLNGTESCRAIDFSFLSLSLAVWSALFFVVICFLCAWAMYKLTKR